MLSIESKKLLLSSAVSSELEGTGKKANFWGTSFPPGETLWQSYKPLTLEETLSLFDPESDDFSSSKDLRLLYGIGWEFIWGKKPPECVTTLRDETIVKARYGLELSELEKLWYNLILVDTDMF
jgi:hypothetical protein